MYPSAQWANHTEIQTVEVGDIPATLEAYSATIRQYEDVTGVSPLRTGGQTKSHQTAFAVNKEDERGQTRTVGYARGLARGMLTNILNMELHILRTTMGRQNVYVPEYKGYLNISKDSLPDGATFNVTGSATLMEKAQERQEQMNAIQAAAEINEPAIQMGGNGLNLDWVQRKLLSAAYPDDELAEAFNQEPPQMAAPEEPLA
jgi:hypothetical protein